MMTRIVWIVAALTVASVFLESCEAGAVEPQFRFRYSLAPLVLGVAFASPEIPFAFHVVDLEAHLGERFSFGIEPWIFLYGFDSSAFESPLHLRASAFFSGPSYRSSWFGSALVPVSHKDFGLLMFSLGHQWISPSSGFIFSAEVGFASWAGLSVDRTEFFPLPQFFIGWTF